VLSGFKTSKAKANVARRALRLCLVQERCDQKTTDEQTKRIDDALRDEAAELKRLIKDAETDYTRMLNGGKVSKGQARKTMVPHLAARNRILSKYDQMFVQMKQAADSALL
jgi:hypothetical protein